MKAYIGYILGLKLKGDLFEQTFRYIILKAESDHEANAICLEERKRAFPSEADYTSIVNGVDELRTNAVEMIRSCYPDPNVVQ